MKKNYKKNNYNKIQKFSIRKYSFGAASVAIASYLMFMGNGAVFADEATVTENTAAKTEEVVTTGEPKKEEAPKVVGTEIAEEKAQKELVASKEKLASYVKEIEGNLSSGKYESKTEESLALLRDAISKANQAANATTKVEVEKAYANLITTVNAKLKSKPVEKKETQAVDTTNGKETVGKKAENTEKKSDSNSIDNTGSKDPRNGKVMDKDNAFRTEATAATHEATTNKVGNISYTMEFSDDAKKEIYLYNQEDTNVDITVNSTAGNISSVKVRGGGNRPLDEATKDSAVQIDGFGWSYKQTLTETPGPVTMNITGKTNERFLGLPPTNRREDQNSVLGDRYLVITDAAGGSVSASSNGVNQPGYFKLVVKSQTYKYSIQQPAVDGDKIGVDDINNLTTADIEKIKNQINIEYSKTSTDARLSSKKGTALENKSDVVKNIEVNGGNITVTYKDDSTDTATISSVVRNNVAPTVSIPYSDPAPNKKEVYLYTGEESNVEITFNDDSGKIKSAALKKGGNIALNNVAGNPDIQDNEYGFTVTAINSESATPAKIKVTGQVSGIAENRLPKTENDSLELVTRFATATDKDGKYIINNAVKNKNNGEIVGTYLTDPGAVTFVLKAQAKKYDMVTPTEADKVAVADPTAVTDEEFAKIKAQLEYSRTNEDKNLESKRGEKVDNTDNKIATITKEGNNIVATYKDGSKDVRPLSDFTKLDKQPAIDAVNTAATEKIAAINATPNATDEEKAVAIAKVNADKEKALTAINDATAKAALDTAKESGTNAIAADNPVVAKKDEAKKAIEAALTAKNNVIDGRDDLTPAQKTAAKEKAAEEAKKAKEAVDAATTDAAVDQAKTAGETAVAAVTPVAKEPAKQAIAKALEDKNAELEKRTDLTAEEKAKAKEEAKNLADAQLAEIDKQPDAAATPEAAQTAQTAVDAAKTKGVDDVTAVNPVAAKKTAAKQAIEAALTAKNNAIDGRDDLTPAQKTAAKEKAAEEAKKAKEAIDAATTDAAVDQAKTAGETAVAAVTPVAKEPAKKAIAKALEDKISEIDERTDLTAEEKAKAKEEAKNLADAQLAEIDKQPDLAATPEAAQTAQTAVDAAKTKGVADVTAVNPVAAKKTAAKQAIEDALTAKNNAIEGRTDLTPEEKQAAKDKAAEEAKNAKEAVDAATTDAAVDQAKTAGETAVAAVTPVAKEPAKKAIAKALEDKNAEIEKRTDLTDEEKAKAKEEAKNLADAQLAEIAKQPDVAATPEAAQTAQTAVDAAKTKGVADVTAVNPVAAKKPAAKKAIEDALTAKNNVIDGRTDLTPEEKQAAKDKAAEEAKNAKEAIDAATTDAAVDQAKTAGETAVAAVTPVAKEPAKQAIAKALEDKNAEIEKRTDLTADEKAKAKEEAKKLADAQLAEIAKQPDAVETPEAGQTAQTAVDAAKKTGVDDVTAVNPEAVTKPAAKKAIDDKLAEQLKTIENTPDATEDEKKVAAEQAKTLAELAKKEIDNKTTDADVNQFTDTEKAEIEKVLPVVEDKPNARKAIDEEATAKKEAIEARTDLTPKAKEDLKAEVDKLAKEAKKAVDNATTTDEVNGVEEAGKTAIQSVGAVNIPANKVLVNDPSALTDEEKAKVLEAVKKVNPDAKEITQDADGNVTVTTPDGHKEIITPEQVVKTSDTANEPKAGNDVVKPADKVVVADPTKLTDAEKEKIKAAVKAVNPNSVVTVDEKGNAKVSTQDGQTQVIPVDELVRTAEDTKKPNAGNDIVKPADKTVVANPDALTPEEKKAIEDKVKAVNPGATVVVDDKGNATVTTPEGKTAVIPSTDLVKSPEDATKPNAGNDIVKPADKTAVANKDALTPEEKKAIEDKVKAVNPGATVVVDDKGNATVTTPEGKTAVIPASDLTKTAEEAAKPNAGNDIVKPADKTVVSNSDALTPEEKKAIEDKVKAVNPGATVVVDDKGNATVTTPEGKTAVIPASDLVKSQEEATKPNAGNDIVKPADKTVVANPDALTPEEKKAIEDKVKAVNPGATVVVDDKGNATVTTPLGNTAVIPATDLTKSPEDAAKPNAGNDIVKPADKTVVANPDALTPEEKKAIEDKVKAVNSGATVVVDDKGNATVTTPEGKTAVIPATDLVKSQEDATKPNAGNDIVKPADKTVVANPDALTPEETKAIEDKVKAVNPDATVVVDDKGNATVTTPEGKTAVIPASDLTKSAADAAKPNAGNDVNTPAAKTVVANPDVLTPEEKKAIEDKVKAVNPGATVVVDDKGNATVTTPEGKTAVIPSSDLVKTQDDTTKENAGNDVNTPAAKTVVANPDALTPEEKKVIEDKVKAVNSGATVVVDDKGNATVTKGDGTVLNIPALDLVIPAENLTDAAKNTAIKTPAFRTLVGSKEQLTDSEKESVKKAIEAVNPGATVVVDDKGNATVTLPDGSTATISKEQLVKDKEDAKAKNGGDNLEFDFSKVTVADLKNITPEEKVNFQIMILGAITDVEEFDISTLVKTTDAEGNTVYTSKDGKVKITIDKDGNATIEKDGKKELAISIDKAGNVTIVTKDGKVLAIPRDDAFKQRSYVPQYDNTASKVDKSKLELGIRNLDSLIASQLDQLDAAKAKEAKALLAEAKEVFGNPNATQAEVDAMVKRLEEFKLNQASVATDDQAANNAANASNGETSEDAADDKLAANVSNRNKQKELPNTGTSTFGTVLPAIAALLSGVGVFATKKKEDE